MQRNRLSIVAAMLALGLGVSGLAQAQPGPDRGRPGPHGGPPPHAHPAPHMRPPPPPPPHMHDRRGPPPHAGMRGAGPDHRWVKGSRIPPQFRTRHYVVEDWRRHRLSAPPRGYHWVQYGGDYLLVAIATGIVTQLVLNGGF